MRYYVEEHLYNFQFWSGAKENANLLTLKELEQIEFELSNIYPEGLEDVQINDIFWFDFDFIAQLLGYEDEEEFRKERENN